MLLPQVRQLRRQGRRDLVFLAAYSIPVTFDSVMSVIGSSSAANMTSVTPGAVGVTQAANVVALQRLHRRRNATAYSLTQQLVTTAVNIGYALVLVVVVFGWTGGKALVSTSYSDAKVKVTNRNTTNPRQRARAEVRDEASVFEARPRGHLVWMVNTAALMLLAWILQGFSIESWGSGLALAAVLGLLNALVWPLLIRVALPLTVITLGFGVLLLNGVFVWLASAHPRRLGADKRVLDGGHRRARPDADQQHGDAVPGDR